MFLDNAGKMGIDIHDLNFVMLSRSGLDQWRELVQHLIEARMEGIAYPPCFCPCRALPHPGVSSFELEISSNPLWTKDCHAGPLIDIDDAVSTCIAPFLSGTLKRLSGGWTGSSRAASPGLAI